MTTVAVLVADWLLDGIQHRTIGSLFAASALLGFLNAFVRPLLLMVSLPLLLWSLGLFVLVINALLLLLVGGVLQPGFMTLHEIALRVNPDVVAHPLTFVACK